MHCSRLNDLPSSFTGKVGWPWTEESPQLSDTMPDGRPWPKISIVTPNYNYGQFLEETIRSVLLQGYPNLEYIIIDGGSTDNSIEIIKKYEKWLAYWISEPDRGQSHAINKGLKMASGEWFNWINSDDLLMPHALKTLIKISQIAKDAQWISGARLELAEDGSPVDICVPWRSDPSVIGLGLLSLPQDATFIRLDFLRDCNVVLKEEYVNVFDTVFHFELLRYSKPILTGAVFSAMRWHKNQKTGNLNIRTQESQEGVLPCISKLPRLNRIFIRLLRTRLNPIVQTILQFGVMHGYIPYASDWKAVIFDRYQCTFKIVPARSALLISG